MTRFELAGSDLGGWLLVASRSQLAGAMSLNLRHQCDNHDIRHQCSGDHDAEDDYDKGDGLKLIFVLSYISKGIKQFLSFLKILNTILM